MHCGVGALCGGLASCSRRYWSSDRVQRSIALSICCARAYTYACRTSSSSRESTHLLLHVTDDDARLPATAESWGDGNPYVSVVWETTRALGLKWETQGSGRSNAGTQAELYPKPRRKMVCEMIHRSSCHSQNDAARRGCETSRGTSKALDAWSKLVMC